MRDELAQFTQRRLSAEQTAMLVLLGNPEIVGGAGTALFYISDPAAAGMPFLKPPYALTYYCPVVSVLGRTRQVLPNGDLIEVEPDRIGPSEADW